MIIKLEKLNLEFLKRNNYFFFKKKNKIKKSLNLNKNQILKKKIYIKHFFKLNSKIFKSKQKNRCFQTGRLKYFYKKFNYGRHFLNKQCFFGTIHNTNSVSW